MLFSLCLSVARCTKSSTSTRGKPKAAGVAPRSPKSALKPSLTVGVASATSGAFRVEPEEEEESMEVGLDPLDVNSIVDASLVAAVGSATTAQHGEDHDDLEVEDLDSATRDDRSEHSEKGPWTSATEDREVEISISHHGSVQHGRAMEEENTDSTEILIEEDDDATAVDEESGSRKSDMNQEERQHDAFAPEADSSGVVEVVASLDDAQSKHLIIRAPAIAKQYDGGNPVPISDVLIDSGKLVTWRCHECQHTWRQAVFLRYILKSPCPCCDAKKNPPLARVSKNLVAEWDPIRNDPFVDVETIPMTSNRTAHWICRVCHTSFEGRVKHRVSGKANCPTCSGTSLHQRSPAEVGSDSVENSATSPARVAAAGGGSSSPSAAPHELLSVEWHPIRNGDLRLEQIPPTTTVWWLCSCCGQEWEATVAQRVRVKRPMNCPDCKKKPHA